MEDEHLDSFLLRLAYEMLLQAYRDRDHRNPSIAFNARDYLRSEDAMSACDELVGSGVLWAPVAGEGIGRGKKGGRWGVRMIRSSLMGDTAR